MFTSKTQIADLGYLLREAANNGNVDSLINLLKQNVDINSQGSDSKKTALHRAIINDRKDVIKILLEYNARVDIKDKSGKTAVQYYRELGLSKYMAYCYFMSNRYTECIEECEEIIKDNRENIEILVLLSGAHLQKNEYNMALQYAIEANNLNPSARTYNALYNAYIELHDRENALIYIEKALELEPENYLHHHAKSVLLICLSKMDEAIICSDMMIQLFKKAYPNEEAYLSGHKDILVKHYQGLGLVYLINREYISSLENIEKALKIKPNDAWSLLIKGFLFLHQRKNEEAIGFFNMSRTNGLDIPEINQGIGFAHLYNDRFNDAINHLTEALRKQGNNLTTAIGLFDAYVLSKDYQKANLLCRRYVGNKYFSDATTKTPTLFKPLLSHIGKSTITVYIWNPKHDPHPPYQDADYGHAAMKILSQGKEAYISWWPSGKNYQNAPGASYLAVKNYGKKDDLLTSDKGKLKKSATFKIIFTGGLNVQKLLLFWDTLKSSGIPYNERAFNCCDAVLRMLQASLDETIPNITEVKTSKMLKNINFNAENILDAYRFKTLKSYGTKSTTIYQYCYLLGCSINKFYKDVHEDSYIPQVVIRFNRWNKTDRKIMKFDFDPLCFNPNWMTRTAKMNNENIYLNLINNAFSEVLFEPINEIHGDEEISTSLARTTREEKFESDSFFDPFPMGQFPSGMPSGVPPHVRMSESKEEAEEGNQILMAREALGSYHQQKQPKSPHAGLISSQLHVTRCSNPSFTAPINISSSSPSAPAGLELLSRAIKDLNYAEVEKVIQEMNVRSIRDIKTNFGLSLLEFVDASVDNVAAQEQMKACITKSVQANNQPVPIADLGFSPALPEVTIWTPLADTLKKKNSDKTVNPAANVATGANNTASGQTSVVLVEETRLRALRERPKPVFKANIGDGL